jgi:hypothetical protein
VSAAAVVSVESCSGERGGRGEQRGGEGRGRAFPMNGMGWPAAAVPA